MRESKREEHPPAVVEGVEDDRVVAFDRALLFRGLVLFLANGSDEEDFVVAPALPVEGRVPEEVREEEVPVPLAEVELFNGRRSKELAPRLEEGLEEVVVGRVVPVGLLRVLSLEKRSSKRLEELEEEVDDAAP